MEKIICFLILIIVGLITYVVDKKDNLKIGEKIIISRVGNKTGIDTTKKIIRLIDKDKLKNMNEEEAKQYILNELENNGVDLENLNSSQLGKGDIKVTRSIKKIVTKYSNGKKISEEQTITTDNIDKKAIIECQNCGASLDLEQDICSYCRTKIN